VGISRENHSSKDPFRVDGRSVVVTGGTAGIGLAVADHLVAQGAKVVITGRRPEGSTVAADINAQFVPMDVADQASVKNAFVEIGRHLRTVDCLILNAGVDLGHGEIDALDVDTFQRVLDVNTMGVVRSLAAGVSLMGEGGSVVVTSSPAGALTGPGMAAYSASKAALNMLVRTWAMELGPKQIRVNAVLPGIVESEMDAGSTAELEIIRRMTANGVFRKAAEMGPVFQFLVSDASATLTGSQLGAHDGISVGLSHEMMGYLSAELPTDPQSTTSAEG